ncbi:type IV secretion system protein VirB10 [Castellaniella sp.]|uniref:type IV secretion system protein VirB10 n=1 Tax=Castellaniella sp. TaxID=1955812 RepID=UPI002AFFABD6|nr:type IV secretion system protein VirB10 [Castellaniella sp.]
MFKRKKQAQTIDAASELAKIEGEMGPSQFMDTRRALPPGTRLFMLVILLIGLSVAGLFTWRMVQRAGLDKPQSAKSTDRLELDATALRKPLPPPPVEIAPPAPPIEPWKMPEMPTVDMPTIDPIKTRRLSSPLNLDSESGQEGGSTASGGAGQSADAGPLADKLRPLELSPASASMQGDRDMLLSQGTHIDCTLISRVVTTQPGMITCMVPTEVWSSSGRVVLVDAGTVLTGYQTGDLKQGQDTIFATWSTLRTPAGIVVPLNSPGTGPLGEAGISGHVDTHFGERFGNAILFSLVGDFGAWAAEQGSRSRGDGTSIQLNNTREGTTEVISKVLENSMTIPPTLFKNQGERIGVTVARDLDFSSVYKLSSLTR